MLKTWEGRTIEAKFPLRRLVGGSHHSSVFLTQRSLTQPQKAAIKLIPAQALSPQQQDAQLALWSSAAKLSHPNLLQLFAFGRCQIDNAPYLYVVLEYADEDLSQIIPQRALAPEEVKEMLPPVGEALAYLHQAGFVHSRLKPSNVMAAGDQLKLSVDTVCQIGATKIDAIKLGTIKLGASMIGAGKIGEPAVGERSPYEAPEASRSLTPSSDVWSLGVLLVTVLTQHEPKTQVSANGTVVLSDTIPEPFLGIARRCLQINPQQRPTIDDLLRKPTAPTQSVSTPIISAPTKPAVQPTPAKFAEQIPLPAKPPAKKSSQWIIAAIVAFLLTVAVLLSRNLTKDKSASQNTPSPAQSAPISSAVTPPPVVNEVPKPTQVANTPGTVLHQEQPEVSRQARSTIQGRVKINIQVSVDASGNVSDAKAIPPIPSQYFAKQARSAALRWKFTPPQMNGQPQASNWLLHFQFSHTQTQVSQTRR